jgi:hypothetical protein
VPLGPPNLSKGDSKSWNEEIENIMPLRKPIEADGDYWNPIKIKELIISIAGMLIVIAAITFQSYKYT